MQALLSGLQGGRALGVVLVNDVADAPVSWFARSCAMLLEDEPQMNKRYLEGSCKRQGVRV